MTINANTKIATILKQHPDALDVIVSISPKFEKLRNPLLRKIMAGRTSLAMASKIGGCSVNDFFVKLQPLGFEIDSTTQVIEKAATGKMPEIFTSLKKEQIVSLDVRPVLAAGSDPLNLILENVNSLEAGKCLKIINTFEPIPLIIMLEKKGFVTYTDTINDELIETYFYKKSDSKKEIIPVINTSGGWDEIIQQYNNKLQTIDVRALEMPLPMLTILEALEKLPSDHALYVYHKRIPVFLLPELAEKKFDYRIKEISDGEVHLLIFKS